MPRVEDYRHITEQLPDPSAVILYNRSAGGRIQSQRNLHKIELLKRNLEEKAGLHVDFVQTESAEHARDVVGKFIAKERGLYVVKGGDGTIAPIAQQLAEANHAGHLLPVGGGTQNVLLRELTGHRHPAKVAEDLFFNGQPVQVDLGMIEAGSRKYPFLACADLGGGAHNLDVWQKTGTKNPIRVFKTFLDERHIFEPYDLQVTDIYNDEIVESKHDDIYTAIIVNVGKYGGWFHITQSNMRDGAMEGIIIPSPLARTNDFMRVALQSVQGNTAIRGFSYAPVHQTTYRETNGKNILFQHDGEVQIADSSEITVSTEPKAITLWVSEATISHAFDSIDED
jgi:diacylglycerol kinase family enzyme